MGLIVPWTTGSAPTGPQTYVIEPRPSLIRLGDGIYRRHCAVCHGFSGRGDGPSAGFMNPPPLNFYTKRAASLSDRELYRIVSNGKLETGMPAWKGILSERERRAVIAYIKANFMNVDESGSDSPTRSSS